MAAELERKAERVRLGLDDAAPTPVLASKFFARYLSEIIDHQRAASDVRARFEIHITPVFGHRPLGSITTADVQSFVSAKLREGCAPGMVLILKAALSTAFAVAIKWGMARTNPCTNVAPIKVQAKDPAYLEPEEIAALLKVVPAEWRVCVLVALYTGLRRGELFGLRRDAVNIKARTIRVQWSYGEQITKGNRPRTVPIPDVIAAEFAAHLERVEGDLVFAREDGTMYVRTSNPTGMLNRWLKAAGIKKTLRWHDLRATYATHAASQINARFAQAALGHSSIRTTEGYMGLSQSRLTKQGRGLRLVAGADPHTTGGASAPGDKD